MEVDHHSAELNPSKMPISVDGHCNKTSNSLRLVASIATVEPMVSNAISSWSGFARSRRKPQ